MTTENTDPIALFRAVVAEKRWLQNAWHREIDGREYLCLAAAWGKAGTINDATDCPTDLYPLWLFELMPVLDDGVSKDDLPWLFGGFADRADAMAALDAAAWDRISVEFRCAVIEQALGSAASVMSAGHPAYWPKVQSAAAGVIRSLRGDGDIAGAYAAATVAAATAAGAEAVDSEAATKRIAETLFDLIDAETDKKRLADAGWQPIGTAPIGIQVRCAHVMDPYSWREETICPILGTLDRDHSPNDSGWRINAGFTCTDGMLRFTPTHWRAKGAG